MYDNEIDKMIDVLGPEIIECAVVAVGMNPVVSVLATSGSVLLLRKLRDINKANKTKIPPICKKYIPQNYMKYKDIIITAVELCLEEPDIFEASYEPDKAAEVQSERYIKRHENIFADDEISCLKNILPAVLREVLSNLRDKYEDNREYQILWKEIVTERINNLEQN